MSYGPHTPFAHLRDDPKALPVLRRHLPDLLDEPDTTLQPYTPLGELAARTRAFGDPPRDLTALWEELATVAADDVPQPPPPPVSDTYEPADVSAGSATAWTVGEAERWGIAELELHGPALGNPFVEVDLRATFRQGDTAVQVGGFYDGDGVYRVRFLPPASGRWSFATFSNARSLDGVTGALDVAPPTAGNHGRVIVRDRYHFAYEDGAAYLPLGTTAYAWTHQPAERQEQTLTSLKDSSFTKLRMCLFPKSFVYNTSEPGLFPFERTPDGAWDLTRFSVAYFRVLEQRIAQLRDMGVEADLILFHPYDRWGFSQMPSWADLLYARYVVRRLAAFRNVWWSLANEYDFMPAKTVDDWEAIAAAVTGEDHARHLTSIHNGFVVYDHRRAWSTHASIQKNDTERTSTNVDRWREQFGKPVVVDEIGYEGDLAWGWGNLTGHELVRRAWDGAVRGGYVNHGETYHDDVVWWSHGGQLRGESPDRFAFLARIIAETPSGRFEPLPSDFDHPCGGDEAHRLIYFGASRPSSRRFTLAPGRWDVDVIDTWNMTITTLPEPVDGVVEVPLPGRSYIAVRLRRREERDSPATPA